MKLSLSWKLYIKKKTFPDFCYRVQTKGKQPISFNLIKFVTTEIFPAFNNYDTIYLDL